MISQPQHFPVEVQGDLMSTACCHTPDSGKKGRDHGCICVGLTDRYALSVPARQTPATQPKTCVQQKPPRCL